MPEDRIRLTATITIDYSCERSVYQEITKSNGLLDFAMFDSKTFKKNPYAISQLIVEGKPDRFDVIVTARDA